MKETPKDTRPRERRVFDAIIQYVNRYKTLALNETIRYHNEVRPRRLRPWDDDRFLSWIAAVNAAQHVKVTTLNKMDPAVWLEAFANFRVAAVARLNPDRVKQKYWRPGEERSISRIYLRAKVNRIIDSAKAIQAIRDGFGSFGAYMSTFHIPPHITTECDIVVFWAGAEELRLDLSRRGMPSLGNWPSLLHFLMENMRYDCSKPDVVAMRVGYATEMIPRASGERSRRLLVEAIQHYSLVSGLRPVIVDNYLMCFDGQTGAVAGDLVRAGTPACRSKERCTNADCPIGARGLCRVRRESLGA